MGWAKWATLIGGAALAPFTGGASLAIAAPIAGALDQKEAVKKANEQQQAATGTAQAALAQGNQFAQGQIANAQQGIQQATAAVQPYQQLGNQGANALSTLMGFGGLSAPPSISAAPAASSMPMAAMPTAPTAPSGEPGGHQTLSSFVTDDNATRDMPPSLARAIQMRQQTQSSYDGPNVQGPDGRFYKIPDDQLEAALNAGGRRL